jgi:hypothetical protein
MIDNLFDDFYIDPLKGSKRFGNLSFSVDFDEYLLLTRPGFRREEMRPSPSSAMSKISSADKASQSHPCTG